MNSGALSIQQKFQFEISEVPRVQWNGTFRLYRLDLSHRAFGYCSCKQDKKRAVLETTILLNGKGYFGPTDRNDHNRTKDKVDHLKSWFLIFRSYQTEMVRSICCTNRNFRNFGLNGKPPWGRDWVVSKTKHSKTKHPKLENEAPKTRKRSTQDSKTKPPGLENEAPKSRNHCRMKDYNFKSCMTQAKPGGGNGCLKALKWPRIV